MGVEQIYSMGVGIIHLFGQAKVQFMLQNIVPLMINSKLGIHFSYNLNPDL